MINKQRLINTFCDLVKIDSPSGEEDEIASFLSKNLTELALIYLQIIMEILLLSNAKVIP